MTKSQEVFINCRAKVMLCPSFTSFQRGLQVTNFYRIGFELDDIKAKSVMHCKCNKLICAFLQHSRKKH
jgi:hypothetical protein